MHAVGLFMLPWRRLIRGALRLRALQRARIKDPDIAAAIAQISQGPNGGVRVRLHDKHPALVSIGKHLGMFTDHFKVDAVYGISEEPMSAEEWKKRFVKEG
jgi:2-methylcitrate dehydratase PrpD